VWKETESLRKNGKLLGLAKQIQCPVIAIHGDYDPHPAEGVKKPLSHTIKNFHFILLKNCGHTPWLEKYAREKYFDELQHELNK
jgi:pimeloyl-ACP methyl ester carboxylesterase